MKLFQKIRNLRSRIQYDIAVKKAENEHEKNKSRYYVIPAESGKLIVLDRQNFRLLKKKKYFSNNISTTNLLYQSYYYTADRSGKGEMPKNRMLGKKKDFVLWKEKMYRKRKRDRKKSVSQKPDKK